MEYKENHSAYIDLIINEMLPKIAEEKLADYIDAFLETYADDAEMYSFPDSLTGKGKDVMLKRYGPVFEKYPDLHCEIKGRIVQGNVVIDKEYITATARKPLEGTVVYKIKNNKISEVYFIK